MIKKSNYSHRCKHYKRPSEACISCTNSKCKNYITFHYFMNCKDDNRELLPPAQVKIEDIIHHLMNTTNQCRAFNCNCQTLSNNFRTIKRSRTLNRKILKTYENNIIKKI